MSGWAAGGATAGADLLGSALVLVLAALVRVLVLVLVLVRVLVLALVRVLVLALVLVLVRMVAAIGDSAEPVIRQGRRGQAGDQHGQSVLHFDTVLLTYPIMPLV